MQMTVHVAVQRYVGYTFIGFRRYQFGSNDKQSKEQKKSKKSKRNKAETAKKQSATKQQHQRQCENLLTDSAKKSRKMKQSKQQKASRKRKSVRHSKQSEQIKNQSNRLRQTTTGREDTDRFHSEMELSSATSSKTVRIDCGIIDALNESKLHIAREIGFEYVTENVIQTDQYESVEDNTDIPLCLCSNRNGGGACDDINCDHYLESRECTNEICRVGQSCRNRSMQNGENKKIVIKRTEKKGYGVFAAEKINRCEFVIEYIGEVISRSEYKQRLATEYAIDTEASYYCMELGRCIVDAYKKGNKARFINHSCEPNCECMVYKVNGMERLAIWSKKMIKVGEEITFDYKFESNTDSEMKCFCGSKKCRGVWNQTKTAKSSHKQLKRKNKNGQCSGDEDYNPYVDDGRFVSNVTADKILEDTRLALYKYQSTNCSQSINMRWFQKQRDQYKMALARANGLNPNILRDEELGEMSNIMVMITQIKEDSNDGSNRKRKLDVFANCDSRDIKKRRISIND